MCCDTSRAIDSLTDITKCLAISTNPADTTSFIFPGLRRKVRRIFFWWRNLPTCLKSCHKALGISLFVSFVISFWI